MCGGYKGNFLEQVALFTSFKKSLILVIAQKWQKYILYFDKNTQGIIK